MRIPLLERLPGIVNHLTTRIVNDSIFNNIAMGFVDTSPALRELTVKSMVTLAPKLQSRSMQQVTRTRALAPRSVGPPPPGAPLALPGPRAKKPSDLRLSSARARPATARR